MIAERTARYSAEREELLARPGFGPGERRLLADLTDDWLRDLFAASGGPVAGAGLAAVGGFGRRELSGGSDIDLVLLVPAHDGATEAAAESLWYPIWDAGLRLDHSIRTPAECRRVAAEDLPAAVGMLDLRHVTGVEALSSAVRSEVLAAWRAAARKRLPQLLTAAAQRHAETGDVRHTLSPDLKYGRGGLRDADLLRAVRASWLVDAPHQGVPEAEDVLRDVRYVLHQVGGRGDRLVAELQQDVATAMGLGDRDELLALVYQAGRTISQAVTATERAVRALTAPRLLRGRRPRVGLAQGVVRDGDDVALARDAKPESDSVLPLRVAAAAARAGLPLTPGTVTALKACPPLPVPWSGDARDQFVQLLGAGAGLVDVWEVLDQAGLVQEWIPEWGRIAHLPQRSPVHIYSVDRHSLEAVVRAAALTRQVSRPDLLLLAALLHDIGKGSPGEHCQTGAALVPGIAERVGLPADDAKVLARLTELHLLLPDYATRRDLDDPATAESAAVAIGDVDTLNLLAALVQADAQAAGPAAWSTWRAGLISDLVGRTRARLAGKPPAEPAELVPDPAAVAEVQVATAESTDGVEVRVSALDRPGLLAAVAGLMAIHRLSVRSARLRSVDGLAAQVWQVRPEFGDPPTSDRLRADLRRILDSSLDLSGRLAAREAAYPTASAAPATVALIPDVSPNATVVEVRAADRSGLLHDLAAAITTAQVDVVSALVSTHGADAVDVLYLTRGGRPLDAGRTADVLERLSQALA
jgi:[protein-PII] uridylyltransferase